uniref:RanBP2-type domain-containing protein n=1 Tax=Salix viminalis TaxID=40686 RepID=A0A6N2LXK6_SALVM
MAQTPISLLLLRRLTLTSQSPKPPPLSLLLNNFYLKPYSTTTNANPSTEQPKPSPLSARLSFVFDQIDSIERERAEKHHTLQKIRVWRQSKDTPQQEQQERNPETISTQSQELVGTQNPETILSQNENLESGPGADGISSVDFEESDLIELKRKEVELVHPWPEWIELMERLVQQNYFDHRRKVSDNMIACLNFGKDRFDIFRSLSRQDIQILVGYGCPSVDKKVVFSSKLLRKHVHLDEGDVCSNCSLRSSCERGYLITNKEDEARTIDLMRVFLAYGFESINGSVTNKSLLKQKSVRTVVRKLLHEVVKLAAVPIDPNLPPPVIKRPPPKVKQPPPPPRKRVGRDDIEMKRGDWLCPKCDFMNFAKNTVCLQCDAKRPKRQLLPGEWECPECNFLNYRRNMACFHCDCKRPPDAFMENKMEERQYGSRTRSEKIISRPEVSNAWNFDFDDNESDGADVAAFENADSASMVEDSPMESQAKEGNFGRNADALNGTRITSRVHEREYSDPRLEGFGRGFDDFDDEDDIDSYEIDTQNDKPAWKASRNNFSDQGVSELEDDGGSDDNLGSRPMTNPSVKTSKPRSQRDAFYSSNENELDIDSDEERSVHPKWKSSHVADVRHKNRGGGPTGHSKGLSFGSDEELDSDVDDDFGSSQRKQRTKGSGRRNERNSDWEDASISGSESDGNDRRSWRNKSGANRTGFGRRDNNFRDHDNGFVRDNEMRTNGKMGDRRKSWGDDFDRSSPGPHGKNRGFQGNDRSGWKMNGAGGDRRKSWSDDFERSSPIPHGKNRGFQGNGRSGRKMDDAGGDRRKSWSDDFDRSSPDPHGKNRGFRGNGRSGWKTDDAGGDRRKSWSDDFDRSSPGPHGKNRGFRGNDRSGWKMDDTGGDSRNFNGPKRGGFRKQQGGRSHEYNMDKDPGEFRNSRRVIER